MYLVIIAWAYVVLLMALAEGLSTNGTWLGAFFTLVLYGVLPLSVVIYLMGTPLRRRQRQRETAAEPTPQAPLQDGHNAPSPPSGP